MRLGVRNRLQTKRDALTFDWLELDTFFQVNVYQPHGNSAFVNELDAVQSVQPVHVPAAAMGEPDGRFAVAGLQRQAGFTEIDSSLTLQADRNLDVTISHLYLDNNPFFANSSLLRCNVYYRLDDNWAAGFSERYEFAQHQLQAQSYTLYRDLSELRGVVGLTVRNNNGVERLRRRAQLHAQGRAAGEPAGGLRRELGGERPDAVRIHLPCRKEPRAKSTKPQRRRGIRTRGLLPFFPFCPFAALRTLREAPYICICRLASKSTIPAAVARLRLRAAGAMGMVNRRSRPAAASKLSGKPRVSRPNTR